MGEPSLQALADFMAAASRQYGFDLHTLQGMAPDVTRRPAPALDWQPGGDPGRSEAATYRDTAGSAHPSPEVDAAWCEVTEAYRNGRVLVAIATGWNRGGLLVRWNRLQGFVPASQLKEMPLTEDEACRDEQLAHWVGEELQLKVIELDRGRNRLVFSERATIWGPRDGERVLQEITPGQVRPGQVSNLCDFGVFVDLGGVDGLIHISELSWGRVNHPRELLSIGQEVHAYVLSVDRANRRIALSLKRLQENPWAIVQARYQVGQLISAVVTNVVDFGAFAQIEEGLEGLIHISEMPEDVAERPSSWLHVGDQVPVRIVRIDSVSHRLGLSMRDLAEPTESTPDPAAD
jgi:small subunit ribosomal protein S1